MTRKMIGFALVVLFVVAAASAYAEAPAAKNLSLSIGAYMPTSSTTRDNLGSTWLDVGLAYKLPAESKMMQGWDAEIGVAYMKAKGETLVLGDGTVKTKAWIIPATITLKKPVQGTNFYFGAGVGAYFTKVEKLTAAGAPSATASESKTKFGYQLVGGYNFTPNIGLELGWAGVGKVQSQKLDGWSVSVVGKF